MIFDLYDEEDVKLIQSLTAENKSVGLTSGSFDLTHAVHIHYLNACRRLLGPSGMLVVGIDSDHLILQRKGSGRPAIPEADRIFTIGSIKCVAAAFTLGSVEDFGRAVSILGIDFIFKNQYYKNIKVLGADEPGVELIIIPDFQRAESTTDLITKIITSQS